jgi:hypothetical protein
MGLLARGAAEPSKWREQGKRNSLRHENFARRDRRRS